jgi:hypothetical protein
MWYKLDDTTRTNIKEALLHFLESQDMDTLKNVSICLGIIAAIEVPDGNWNDFLQ